MTKLSTVSPRQCTARCIGTRIILGAVYRNVMVFVQGTAAAGLTPSIDLPFVDILQEGKTESHFLPFLPISSPTSSHLCETILVSALCLYECFFFCGLGEGIHGSEVSCLGVWVGTAFLLTRTEKRQRKMTTWGIGLQSGK